MALEIQRLPAFQAWLSERGLTDGTIAVYLGDVRLAAEAGGFLQRLRDDELAPKTRRHILAAGRHWARFVKDADLSEQLGQLRLPPAHRKSARVPISRDQLLTLVAEIERAPYLEDKMRSVLLLMAKRGLRCGDVLRIRRTELKRALEDGTLAFEAKGRRRLEFKVLRTFAKPLKDLAACPGSWQRLDELVSPEATPAGRRKASARAVGRALERVGVRIGVFNLYPHRLRRTYAVEYLRTMRGDPEALVKLTQHMQWANMSTAMEYVDHARGDELDGHAERIFEL